MPEFEQLAYDSRCMSASLLTVWRAARARAVPFAGESAGFVVLLACEELALSPRKVELANLSLDPEGGVRTLGRQAAAEAETEAELRSILGELLQVSSTPGAGLLRVASREPAGSLRALALELQKALVPLNRGASRRALSRLSRETLRAAEAGKLAPLPSPEASSAVTPALGWTRGVQDASALGSRLPQEKPASRGLFEPSPAEPVPVLSEVFARARAAGWTVPSTTDHPTRPEPVIARQRNERSVSAPQEVLDELTEQCTFLVEPSADRQLPLVGKRPEPPEASSSANATEWPMGLATESRALPLEPEWVETKAVPPRPMPPSPQPLASPESSDFEIDWEIGAESGSPVSPAGDSGFEAEHAFGEGSHSAAVTYPGMPPQRSDVRQLLGGFEVAQALEEGDLRGELKRWAGVEGTPTPRARQGRS